MGAANPLAAARKVVEVARALGLSGLKVAAVLGDDVLDLVRSGDYRLEETGAPLSSLGDRVVSANAYMGAGPIVDALRAGAHVVITGRSADPALFMAPLLHEFGWAMDDWDRLGQARWWGICWSVPARSPAATLPTLASRTCRIWRGSVSPSVRSAPTAPPSSPRCRVPVGASTRPL